MKYNKIFSIDEEIIQMLKNEKNQSGIVNGLLRDYFSISKPLDEKISEAQAERQKADALIEDLTGKKIIYEQEREKIVQEQEVEDEEYQKSDAKKKIREDVARSAFEKYQIDKEIFEIMLQEYLTLYEHKEVRNITEYMQSRGIELIPPRHQDDEQAVSQTA